MPTLEVLRQYTDSKHGNDCLIEDTVVQMHIHNTYVVEVIRRYYGWCDNGLDFRSEKEFDNQKEADDYYDWLVENENWR